MSDDSSQQTPVVVFADRYRLGARRGASADSGLFEAVDLETDQPVVVKMVHPDLSGDPDVQSAFRSTLDVVGPLQHPHVAHTLAWGSADWNGQKVLYVVSEQLAGGSLRDLLDRGRLLSPSQALMVGLDACKALDALHRRGVVHGDIRPATMVFGADRRLRLVDVGLASLLIDATGGAAHRPNDAAQYVSPEEAMGEPRGPKSDVYALCITLLETLTGSVPFAGDSTVATLANRVDKLMPVSADLGPLASVLERAGRPTPADRFTAAELGRALVAAAQRLPRPTPLPILANSLFGPDPGSPDEPVDPTGPLGADGPTATETAATEPTATVPAVPSDAPDGVETPGVDDDGESVPDIGDDLPEAQRSRRWLFAAAAAVAIAAVGVGWYTTRPDRIPVPALVGMEEGVALNAIAGKFESVVQQEASDDVSVGSVIRTDPAEGTVLAEGSTVTLVVSSGPAPRTLPELRGGTAVDARTTLESLGLVPQIGDPVYDETVPLDQVISWTVPDQPSLVAGGTVTKGTAVVVVVSAGPQPRVVPDLAGSSLADARAALEQLGLVVEQGADEFSPTVPAGQVSRVDPAPTSTVQRGSTVTLYVSKGPDLVTFPSLAGLDATAIRATLESAGFKVGTVSGDATLAFVAAVVNGQYAVADQQFPRGTAVDLYFATS
jgi:serine/threonine-protein kinase